MACLLPLAQTKFLPPKKRALLQSIRIQGKILRFVNSFSDSLLSRCFQGRVVETVQPFHRGEIIKALLNAMGVVEAVDEGENALHCFLPGAEPTDGVHQLLLHGVPLVVYSRLQEIAA